MFLMVVTPMYTTCFGATRKFVISHYARKLTRTTPNTSLDSSKKVLTVVILPTIPVKKVKFVLK